MPAAAKTTNEEILEVARDLLEKHGPDGVSMQAIAAEVGVRAPSLYKRFAHRDALLAELERGVMVQIRSVLEHGTSELPPKRRLVRMAGTYRRWAKSHPNGYALVFRSALEETDAAKVRAEAVEPVLRALSEWLEKDDVLQEARVLTAFLHGFVSMEIAGAFRLGPGVESAFEAGVDAVLRGIR